MISLELIRLIASNQISSINLIRKRNNHDKAKKPLILHVAPGSEEYNSCFCRFEAPLIEPL